MADFNKAYEKTRQWEGGYAKLKGDNGGETMWGIARNYHGDNSDLRDFWKELDHYTSQLKDAKQINEICAGNTVMLAACKKFYKKNFWDVIRGDSINNQKIAENIFDFHANAGKNAIRVLQRLLGTEVDGLFGFKTLNALNAVSDDFNAKFTQARIDYYKSLNKSQFINGWTNRANGFK